MTNRAEVQVGSGLCGGLELIGLLRLSASRSPPSNTSLTTHSLLASFAIWHYPNRLLIFPQGSSGPYSPCPVIIVSNCGPPPRADPGNGRY